MKDLGQIGALLASVPENPAVRNFSTYVYYDCSRELFTDFTSRI